MNGRSSSLSGTMIQVLPQLCTGLANKVVRLHGYSLGCSTDWPKDVVSLRRAKHSQCDTLLHRLIFSFGVLESLVLLDSQTHTLRLWYSLYLVYSYLN